MEELAARSQQFWLPLERAGGQQLGQLLVSLLFTKVRGCTRFCRCTHPALRPFPFQPPAALVPKKHAGVLLHLRAAAHLMTVRGTYQHQLRHA